MAQQFERFKYWLPGDPRLGQPALIPVEQAPPPEEPPPPQEPGIGEIPGEPPFAYGAGGAGLPPYENGVPPGYWESIYGGVPPLQEPLVPPYENRPAPEPRNPFVEPSDFRNPLYQVPLAPATAPYENRPGLVPPMIPTGEQGSLLPPGYVPDSPEPLPPEQARYIDTGQIVNGKRVLRRA